MATAVLERGTKKKITITALSSKDYDKLPHRYTAHSKGMAIPKTGKAYIRITGDKSVDEATLRHEVEELYSSTSAHEDENGVRYSFWKNPMKSVKNIVSGHSFGSGGAWGLGSSNLSLGLGLIPGFGPLLAAANSGYGGYRSGGWQGALMGGLSGLAAGYGMNQLGQGVSAGWRAAGANGGGLLSQLSSGVRGGLLGSYVNPTTGATSLLTNVNGAQVGIGGIINRAAGGALTGGATGVFGGTGAAPGMSLVGGGTGAPMAAGTHYVSGSSLLGGGGTGAATTANAGANIMNGVIGGAESGMGGPGSLLAQAFGPQAAAGGAAGAAGTGGNILSMLDNPLVKMGLSSMAMSALPINATPPNVSESASKWLTTDAVTKAGKLASTIQSDTMVGEFTVPKETMALIQTGQSEIQKAYKQRALDLDKMNSATNENWLQSGERLELHAKLAEAEAADTNKFSTGLMAQAQATWSKQRFDYVINALDVDDDTKRELLYADLADATAKYSIDQKSIMDLRELFAKAGGYMLEGAKQGQTSVGGLL